MTFTGHVRFQPPSGWQPLADQQVAVHPDEPPFIQPDGAGLPRPAITAISKSRVASFKAPRPAEGHWAYYRHRHAARLGRLKLRHYAHYVTVTGRVTDNDGKISCDCVSGWVKLYYRAKGSKTWHYDGKAKLDRDGEFWFDDSRHRKGYYFRLVFPRQGFLLGSTSKTV